MEPGLTPEKLKLVHSMIIQQEKYPNSKNREYSKTPAFAGFKMFALTSAKKMLVNDALRRYYSIEDEDPISAAEKLFADVIIHSSI